MIIHHSTVRHLELNAMDSAGFEHLMELDKSGREEDT
jgi:hypothetical protein